MKKIKIVTVTALLTLGLSISAQNLLAAWITPSFAPPNQNISRPIDQGSSSQQKFGGLIINRSGTPGSTGLLVEQGNLLIDNGVLQVDGPGDSFVMDDLGVGLSVPQAKLHVSGNVLASDNIKTTAYLVPGTSGSAEEGAIRWVTASKKLQVFNGVSWFDLSDPCSGMTCDDGNVCTINQCSSGACSYPADPAMEGQSCGSNDSCLSGVCTSNCAIGYTYNTVSARCEAAVVCSSGSYDPAQDKCDTGIPPSISGSGSSQNTNADTWFGSLHRIEVSGGSLRYSNTVQGTGGWVSMNSSGTSQAGQFRVRVSNHSISADFWHGTLGWQNGGWASLINGGSTSAWWNISFTAESLGSGASRIRANSGGPWINLTITGGLVDPTCPSPGTLDTTNDVCYVP